jgi:hypothetical protein
MRPRCKLSDYRAVCLQPLRCISNRAMAAFKRMLRHRRSRLSRRGAHVAAPRRATCDVAPGGKRSTREVALVAIEA